MVNGHLKTVADHWPVLQDVLKELRESDILVGIPEQKASPRGKINDAELLYIHTHGIRKQSMRQEMQRAMDGGSPYSEAYQLYIQEHGSPLWHSPPRPVLEPAIRDSKEEIAEQLSKAVVSLLDGNPVGCSAELQKAGMVAENAARGWFTNPKNGWPPNAPVTAEQKGSDKPLIDTGELRKSITHVVRRRGADNHD